MLTASPTRLSLNGQNFVFRHGVLPASCWEFPKFVGLTERSKGLKLSTLASRLFLPYRRKRGGSSHLYEDAGLPPLIPVLVAQLRCKLRDSPASATALGTSR